MKNRAFTMIELLVVIAIMGILTIITVSQFQTARKKSRDVARKGDLNAVSKALLMYFNDYNVFPEEDNGLIKTGDGLVVAWGGEFVDRGYTYMKLMPKENNSGFEDYCYQVSLDRKKFAIFSRLENDGDSDYNKYDSDGYSACGQIDYYNFVYFSPNAAITDF